MGKVYAGIGDLTESIALKRGITKKEAEVIVKDVIDAMKYELSSKDKDGIQFIDFITLRKIVRKSKVGRNPRNPLTEVIIPSQIGIKATLGKSFNTELNS